MIWVDRLAELFWVVSLVGAGLGIYVISKSRSSWAYLATFLCVAGFILPMYGVYLVPDQFESWLLPVTKPGIVVSFFLSVGPWFYLLPQALPEPKRTRRRKRS